MELNSKKELLLKERSNIKEQLQNITQELERLKVMSAQYDGAIALIDNLIKEQEAKNETINPSK